MDDDFVSNYVYARNFHYARAEPGGDWVLEPWAVSEERERKKKNMENQHSWYCHLATHSVEWIILQELENSSSTSVAHWRERLSLGRPLPFEAAFRCYVAITTTVIILWASKSRKPDCKVMLNTFLSPSSGIVDHKVHGTPLTGSDASGLDRTSSGSDIIISQRGNRSLIDICTVHQ